MKFALIILCVLAPSCATKKGEPDPSLFGDQSADWQDGFRTGFYEGLTYNPDTNP